MNEIIEHKTFDEERALYHLVNTKVHDCTFAGDADGESVLKECRNIAVDACHFSLRYPLWHAKTFSLTHSTMDELTRASIWYSSDGIISDSTINGIKCLRECENIRISSCHISSPEFGWKCNNISIDHSEIESEYIFFDTNHISIANLTMKGKYSFQYTNHVHIKDSVLDTKDAFWHSHHVTVENSTVKGEYLGWFSDGLTLINCKIIGTQPLCYCKNLKLIHCTMEETDLAFEYSDVEADITSHILSIKNPKSGTITADGVGEIIQEDPVMPCYGRVIIRSESK